MINSILLLLSRFFIIEESQYDLGMKFCLAISPNPLNSLVLFSPCVTIQSRNFSLYYQTFQAIFSCNMPKVFSSIIVERHSLMSSSSRMDTLVSWQSKIFEVFCARHTFLGRFLDFPISFGKGSCF